MLASIVGIAYSRRTRRPFALLAFAVLAVLPLIASRRLPLFALGVLFLAGGHIADAWQRWSESRGADKASIVNHRLFGQLLVGVFLIGSVVFIVRAVPRLGCIQVDKKSFPVQAVALLKKAKVRGDMAGEFNWGEYVIWHLGPAVRVSIDGRRETVYSKTEYQNGLNFMSGIQDWEAVLRKDRVELATVRAQQPAYNLMKQKGQWDLLFEDSVSALFVKHDSALVAQIKAATTPTPAQPDSMCFP
jgi:hypothetical protein